MTPTLSAEQLELRDSFRSFLAEHAPLSSARKRFESSGGSDSAQWQKLMELGVLSYFSERAVAGGGTARELGLLAAEAGYGLLGENLIHAAAILHLLADSADTAAFSAINSRFGGDTTQRIGDGSLRLCLAHPHEEFTTISLSDSNGIQITGTVQFVSNGDAAAFILIPERRSGTSYLCDIRGDGATRVRVETLDRTSPRDSIVLTKASAIELTLEFGGIERLWRSLTAAELGGAARRALELTVDYSKTREQFDVPIGGFQAVQHAAADMLVRVEALSALADFACWTCDSSPDQSTLAALSAAIYGSEEAPKVIEKGIQLHGGIGFTWEHDLHLLLRRVRTLAALLAPRADTYSELIATAQQS